MGSLWQIGGHLVTNDDGTELIECDECPCPGQCTACTANTTPAWVGVKFEGATDPGNGLAAFINGRTFELPQQSGANVQFPGILWAASCSYCLSVDAPAGPTSPSGYPYPKTPLFTLQLRLLTSGVALNVCPNDLTNPGYGYGAWGSTATDTKVVGGNVLMVCDDPDNYQPMSFGTPGVLLGYLNLNAATITITLP